MELSAETRRFIEEHKDDDIRKLALEGRRYPEVDLRSALRQIAGRQAIATKVPSWKDISGLFYPEHLPLEQCSSEITALYKASLCNGGSLVDLTGGFGVDCAFMAREFRSAVYVERQEELCGIARHNFPVLGLNHISIRNEDSTAYLNGMEPVDCIFIDPARRSQQGRKTVLLADCEPDVSQLETLFLAKASKVIIKLSPMLDVSLALKELKNASEVHILSVVNECKELLVILEKEASAAVPIHCLNLTATGRQQFTFAREEELETGCQFATQVEEYLYEPNASILKAGAYKSIAREYGLKKLHPNSHLYTSSTLISDFPGRVFRVNGCFSLKDKLLTAGITHANITVRNFPLSPEEIRKRLKLKDGGETYIFATTLAGNARVLIRCEKA